MHSPTYALIDCDNFFVSCERVFRPDLWRKPVVVLSSNDGCIVARSNEVRKLGVSVGVPLFQVAPLLKQHGVTLFSGNFSLYGDFSQRVVQILQNACPEVEVYSIDESFLQVGNLNIDGYTAWAAALRQRIWRWTGLPVSIGVATTKTLAKAAAEYAKKHPETGGVYSLAPDQQLPAAQSQALQTKLLSWLPVGDIWGVGRRTAPKLRQRGISSAYELVQVTDRWAREHLSISGLRTIKELRGEACLGIAKPEPQQSIARTRLLGNTIRNYYELEGAVAAFAAQAAAKLRQQAEVAGAVLTFLRPAKQYAERSVSSVTTLIQPTADTGQLITAALNSLQRLYDPDLGYKKAGVILLDLAPKTAWQLSLLEQTADRLDRQAKLMQVIDQVNHHYGTRLIRHTSEHPARHAWHAKGEHRSPAYTTSWQGLPSVKA